MNPSQATWDAAKAGAEIAPGNPAVKPCPRAQPKITVSWRDHDFDRVRKGATPPTKELVITSSGEKDLANITITSNSDQFKIGGGAGTLAPGATATVNITFQPTAFGDKTAAIRITSNAVNENPIELQVKGKQYAVITFVVEDQASKKLADVKLKIKQKDQPEQEVTTGAGGKVEFETEKEGDFEIQLGDAEDVLEFQSLTTA